jgi:hypothetical protein
MVISGLALRNRNVLPGLDCVHLAGARFLRGHALDGRLGVCEARDPLPGSLSPCGSFQRPGEVGAFCVVGLLVVAYVSFEAHTTLAVLPNTSIRRLRWRAVTRQ